MCFEMDVLKEFAISVTGMREGVYPFDFQIDKTFFDCFEQSIIKEGAFEVKLYFDKRPDMYVLNFEYEGHAQVEQQQVSSDHNVATMRTSSFSSRIVWPDTIAPTRSAS